MSYGIDLLDPVTRNPLVLDQPHHMRGGTYPVGGSPTASLNITYNYSKHFSRVLGEEGIRAIYGMTGATSIPILQKGIDNLKDDKVANYWEPTEGNAKSALFQLLALAQMRPDGVWDGD